MDYNVIRNKTNMLNGNLNRMIVTDNLSELESMYKWALLRLKNIYKEKREELKKRTKKTQSEYYSEPECYTPNDSPYPLCVGNGSPECEDCCIYEDFEEPPFD